MCAIGENPLPSGPDMKFDTDTVGVKFYLHALKFSSEPTLLFVSSLYVVMLIKKILFSLISL